MVHNSAFTLTCSVVTWTSLVAHTCSAVYVNRKLNTCSVLCDFHLHLGIFILSCSTCIVYNTVDMQILSMIFHILWTTEQCHAILAMSQELCNPSFHEFRNPCPTPWLHRRLVLLFLAVNYTWLNPTSLPLSNMFGLVI